MYATVCMDIVSWMDMDLLLNKNLDYNKLRWHKKYK